MQELEAYKNCPKCGVVMELDDYDGIPFYNCCECGYLEEGQDIKKREKIIYDLNKNQIFREQLKIWVEKRGSTIEGERDNFRNNMLEKLEEFIRAERTANVDEQINVLCDMAILWMTCDFVEYTATFNDDLGVSRIKSNTEFISEIGRVMKNWDRSKSFCSPYSSCSVTQFFIFAKIYLLGYNPYIELDKKIKKIVNTIS